MELEKCTKLFYIIYYLLLSAHTHTHTYRNHGDNSFVNRRPFFASSTFCLYSGYYCLKFIFSLKWDFIQFVCLLFARNAFFFSLLADHRYKQHFYAIKFIESFPNLSLSLCECRIIEKAKWKKIDGKKSRPPKMNILLKYVCAHCKLIIYHFTLVFFFFNFFFIFLPDTAAQLYIL